MTKMNQNLLLTLAIPRFEVMRNVTSGRGSCWTNFEYFPSSSLEQWEHRVLELELRLDASLAVTLTCSSDQHL